MRILISLLICSSILGCNNQRTNRLSGNSVCKPDQDIAAYSFTKDEAEAFNTIESLPEGKAFRAVNITATVEIPDDQERRITVSLVNSKPDTNPTGMAVSCLNGLDVDSKTNEPSSIKIPLTNEKGDIIYQTTKIEIASAKKEAQGKLVYIYTELSTPPETENAEEEEITPQPFASFFDQEGDEFSFHQLKEGKDKDKIFFLHFQNKNKNTRARITLEMMPDTDKE